MSASLQADHSATPPAKPGAASRPVLTILLLLIVAAAGLWVSYHRFRWAWHIEGDIAGPYLIWKQVLRDGPRVLLEWRYAQDNWLFSLTLPDFILLGLTGGSPWALLHQGWVLMLLNSALTGVVLSMVVSRRVAAGIAIALLFAGPTAVGGTIYLSYPVTHNITLAWGLAALWLYLLWLRSGRWPWIALASLVMFLGDISDPWLQAVLVLPVMLAGALTTVLGRTNRLRYAAVVLSAIVVFGLTRTRLLTLLWFLPGSDFAWAGHAVWAPHLGWIGIYTTAMFNAVPGLQPGPDAYAPVWLIVLNCALLALVLVWSALRLLRRWPALPAMALFLAATALLSIGGIGTAFVISKIPTNFNVGRYIANWFYFVPMVVAIAVCVLPAPRRDWLRRVALLWAALVVVAGASARPDELTRLPDGIALPETNALIRFLDDNHLTYGYAPFWATHGAAAEWMSGGRIVIRPVSASSSGRLVLRIAQTFPSWALTEDVPPNQDRFFFIAAPDGEVCPDIAHCVAMAKADWGEPQEVLQFGEFPVLVWHHPTMTGLPDAAIIAAAPVLQPGVPVIFNRDGVGGALQGSGWSGVEEQSAWTEGRRAVLKIHLPDGWSGPATLVFRASAFPARTKRAPQTVRVVVDGQVLTTWTIQPWHRADYEVTLPASIAERRLIAMVFDIPDATRPSDLSYVFDIRSLGMYLTSLTLRP